MDRRIADHRERLEPQVELVNDGREGARHLHLVEHQVHTLLRQARKGSAIVESHQGRDAGRGERRIWVDPAD
eukprot:4589521-Pyramimonas_sp.AAC.1